MNQPIKLPPILTIIVLQIINALAKSLHPPIAPALYVFGDSLCDSGNNNFLFTMAKANFPPYGMDFVKGPTGRFTNGRTVVDFIAEFLRLPLPPPYLSLQGKAQRLRGLNFASASCGILPETGFLMGKCLNLDEQIDYFQETVEEKLSNYYPNTDELLSYMSKSVFLIAIGSNDYINNYLDHQYLSSKLYHPEAFAELLIDKLSIHFQRLYQLGARKIVVFEMGPIGCIPSTRKTFKHNGQCVEEINLLAIIFNHNLATMLQNLTSTLQGSSFVLGKVYQVFYDAISNPSKYGLSDVHNPCCVAWLNGTSACIPGFAPLVCNDPEEHFFWDGYHLTESMYRIIASSCIHGSSVCTPKNIKDLVLL